MKHYELLFVVKPTLTAEESEAKKEGVSSILEKNGASITNIQDMGVRKLAYEIEKYNRGHYYVVYFEITPSAIDEILRNLRHDEDIIRFLNVKFEKKKEIAHWEKLVANSSKSEKKVETKKEEAPVEETKKEETPSEE